jgi:hypothetical protein
MVQRSPQIDWERLHDVLSKLEGPKKPSVQMCSIIIDEALVLAGQDVNALALINHYVMGYLQPDSM